jgi:hypothetical protein
VQLTAVEQKYENVDANHKFLRFLFLMCVADLPGPVAAPSPFYTETGAPGIFECYKVCRVRLRNRIISFFECQERDAH